MNLLPTFKDFHEWMVGRGMQPLPAPDLEPSRRGLARYAMRCAYQDLFAPGDERYGDGKYEGIEDWDRLYRSCIWAYEVLLQEFHIRIPHDLWDYERARIDEILTATPRPEGDSPKASSDRVYRDKVLRWARTKAR